MKRQYFLVCANFLAAIGGGIILAAKLVKDPDSCLKESILAFFAGAVIGLLLSRLIPSRWTNSWARWFSINVALASIVLYEIEKTYGGVNNQLHWGIETLFFSLLSIRFGLWFFSRALRAQIVGSEKQGVALIELGYYSGAAVGLMLWAILDKTLLQALLVDSLIQSAVGAIDFLFIGKGAGKNQKSGSRRSSEDQSFSTSAGNESQLETAFNYSTYWRLTTAVVCLTIGFQAVPFSLAKSALKEMEKYVLPSFYFGVGLSALVCRLLRIKFDWDSIRGRLENATISSEMPRFRLRFSFGLITVMAAVCMGTALLGIDWWHWSTPVLILIAVSAFIYQILVLSLLDRIGREEKRANLKEMIKQTYLIAAVATIVSIAGLSCLARSYVSYVSYAIVTTICCVISFSAVRKNSSVYPP